MISDTLHIIPRYLVMTSDALHTKQATRLNPQATAALDLIFAREAVHEFKSLQHI